MLGAGTIDRLLVALLAGDIKTVYIKVVSDNIVSF